MIEKGPWKASKTAPKNIESSKKMSNNIKVIEYENGDKYEGPVVKEKHDGIGIFTYSNGDKYESLFKEATWVKGKFTFHDGSWYDGEFRYDDEFRVNLKHG